MRRGTAPPVAKDPCFTPPAGCFSLSLLPVLELEGLSPFVPPHFVNPFTSSKRPITPPVCLSSAAPFSALFGIDTTFTPIPSGRTRFSVLGPAPGVRCAGEHGGAAENRGALWERRVRHRGIPGWRNRPGRTRPARCGASGPRTMSQKRTWTRIPTPSDGAAARAAKEPVGCTRTASSSSTSKVSRWALTYASRRVRA